METNKDILVTDSGNGQIRLVINRPHKHNALSRSVLGELSRTVTQYGRDAGTRFIVLQGAGERYFAAGGDLVDLSSVRTREAARDMSVESRDALDAIRDCDVAVIAYLNGDAICEIGRASWRERVCTYGVISGVAVAIKNTPSNY